MFGPVDVLHRKRRQLDMLSRPPIPRGNDEIADVPVGVVGQEIFDMAEVAVRGVDVVAPDRGDAPQMRIAVAGTGLPLLLSACGDFGDDRRLRKRTDDGVGAEIRRAPIGIPPVIVLHA